MTHKEARKRRQQAEKEELSFKLREVYEKSGLTVNEISRITGFKAATLTSWFIGVRFPKNESAKAVIDKINGYFDTSRREYIDKEMCRNLYIDKVYTILTTMSPKEQGKALIDVYDTLPTVSSPKPPKNDI